LTIQLKALGRACIPPTKGQRHPTEENRTEEVTRREGLEQTKVGINGEDEERVSEENGKRTYERGKVG